MTVLELIGKLAQYPPETPVYFPATTDENVQYECVGVELDDGVLVLLD